MFAKLRDTPVLTQTTPLPNKTTPTKDAVKAKETEKEERVGPLDTPFVGPCLENVLDASLPPSKYYEQYCIDEDCFRVGKGYCHACVLQSIPYCTCASELSHSRI